MPEQKVEARTKKEIGEDGIPIRSFVRLLRWRVDFRTVAVPLCLQCSGQTKVNGL